MKNKAMKARLAVAIAASIVGNNAALIAGDIINIEEQVQILEHISLAPATTTGGQLQVITQETTTSQLLTISQIKQEVEDNGNIGKAVAFEAIVTKGDGTNSKSSSLYVQDENDGILIYGPRTGAELKEGDRVRIKGTTTLYNGKAQIQNAEFEVISSNNHVEPIELTIKEYVDNKELYYARLIKFKGVELGKINTGSNTSIKDTTGSVNIYKIPQGVVTGAKYYDITAIGTQTQGGVARLSVYHANDVRPQDGTGLEFDTIEINIGDTYTLPKLIVFADGSKQEVDIEWNSEELTAVNVNKMGVYHVTGSYAEVDYTVKICVNSDRAVKISEIQGRGHKSELEDLTIKEVKGIVTALNDSYGFYIQSLEEDVDQDDATSEGLYVSAYDANVAVGDIVTITNGKVQEAVMKNTTDNLSITQLYVKKAQVKVESSGNTLPDPIVIGEGGRIPPNKIIDNDGLSVFDPEEDSIDFYESLEGMRVQINEAQVVGANDGGEIPVVPNRGKYSLELISPQGGVVVTEDTLHPEILMISGLNSAELESVESGDVFLEPLTGVMTYQFGIYKMQADKDNYQVETAEYDKNPVTTLEQTENGLRVATFNVWNLAGDAAQERYDGLGKVIAQNLLLPDIIGLEEVQDNAGTTDDGNVAANRVYERLIEAIKAESGVEYSYVQIDPENNADGGTDGANIRIGFLYRADRVQLAPGQAGDATTATEVLKGENGEAKLSLNPGRIEPQSSDFVGTRKSIATEFIFNGEKVFIIGNHFNSKRGDDAPYGSKQPAVLNSEAKRIKQATIVNEFVQDILKINPESKIILLGDMNDHHYSAPLQALAGNQLHNMIYELNENERYSYVYQGRSQLLDNILVNKGLEACTEIEIIHVNTMHNDETKLSDHDPVIIRMDMERANEILKPVTPPTNNENINNPGSSSGSNDNSSSSGSSNSGTTNKTDIVVKEEGSAIDVTCFSTFVTDQLKDEKLEKVVYEAKLSEGQTTVAIRLEADAVDKLIEVNKDFAIRLNEVEITVPYTLMTKDQDIQVSIDSIECADREIKEALPESRTGLVGYELKVKINDKAYEALSQPVQVVFEIPMNVNKDKVGIYIINNGKWEYVGGKVEENRIVANVSIPGQIVLAESTQTFNDIQKHWAQEQIEILAAKHLVIGVEEGIFAPKAKIKAGDFATLLTRMIDHAVTVENDGELLTRAQMAVMLKTTLGTQEVVNTDKVMMQFKDVKECTQEEKEALAYLNEQGILLGQTTSKMAPNEVLTRAEMAVVVNRVLKLK